MAAKKTTKRTATAAKQRVKSPLRRAATVPPHTLFSESSWSRIAEEFGLTDAELHVLKYLFDGYQELSMAQRLRRSPHTVHSHLRRIYAKLDVRNRTELLVRTMAEHLLANQRRKLVAFRPGQLRIRG